MSASCEKHQKELLRFLLLKTAAVRNGVKPGELLRVRHCYREAPPTGTVCLRRRDIFRLLALEYLELSSNSSGTLVLFHHRQKLAATLGQPRAAALLAECGYPVGAPLEAMLAKLKSGFADGGLPHEVGVFVGYPVKDVAGFMRKLEPTPAKCRWKVFGDAAESLNLMNVYRQIEVAAQAILDACDDLPTFFEHLKTIPYTTLQEN